MVGDPITHGGTLECFFQHFVAGLKTHSAKLESQQYRASCLNLLLTAIAYWNTFYLGQAANHLRNAGLEVDEALLAHVSPLTWSETRANRGLRGGFHIAVPSLKAFSQIAVEGLGADSGIIPATIPI